MLLTLLFTSLQRILEGNHFINYKEAKIDSDCVFASKPEKINTWDYVSDNEKKH